MISTEPNGKAYELSTWMADGESTRYQLPPPAIKASKVGLLHAGGGIPCRPHTAATQLVESRYSVYLVKLKAKKALAENAM